MDNLFELPVSLDIADEQYVNKNLPAITWDLKFGGPHPNTPSYLRHLLPAKDANVLHDGRPAPVAVPQLLPKPPKPVAVISDPSPLGKSLRGNAPQTQALLGGRSGGLIGQEGGLEKPTIATFINAHGESHLDEYMNETVGRTVELYIKSHIFKTIVLGPTESTYCKLGLVAQVNPTQTMNRNPAGTINKSGTLHTSKAIKGIGMHDRSLDGGDDLAKLADGVSLLLGHEEDLAGCSDADAQTVWGPAWRSTESEALRDMFPREGPPYYMPKSAFRVDFDPGPLGIELIFDSINGVVTVQGVARNGQAEADGRVCVGCIVIAVGEWKEDTTPTNRQRLVVRSLTDFEGAAMNRSENTSLIIYFLDPFSPEVSAGLHGGTQNTTEVEPNKPVLDFGDDEVAVIASLHDESTSAAEDNGFRFPAETQNDMSSTEENKESGSIEEDQNEQKNVYAYSDSDNTSIHKNTRTHVNNTDSIDSSDKPGVQIEDEDPTARGASPGDEKIDRENSDSNSEEHDKNAALKNQRRRSTECEMNDDEQVRENSLDSSSSRGEYRTNDKNIYNAEKVESEGEDDKSETAEDQESDDEPAHTKLKKVLSQSQEALLAASIAAGWDFATGGGIEVNTNTESSDAPQTVDNITHVDMSEEQDEQIADRVVRYGTGHLPEAVSRSMDLPLNMGISISDSSSAFIWFCNSHSSLGMSVCWLDYEGNAIPRRTLAPGEAYFERSFATHPWVCRVVPARSDSGAESGELYAGCGECLVIRAGAAAIKSRQTYSALWDPSRCSVSFMSAPKGGNAIAAAGGRLRVANALGNSQIARLNSAKLKVLDEMRQWRTFSCAPSIGSTTSTLAKQGIPDLKVVMIGATWELQPSHDQIGPQNSAFPFE